MKIAIFTDTYLPTVDGVVTSLLTTKRELERLGHEVVVFAPQAPGNGTGREDDVVWIRAREFRSYPGYRLAILREILKIAPNMRLTDVIPTGVDVERFHPRVDGSRVREKWGLDSNEVVLHVGRIAREKDLPTLVDAFRRVKQERPAAKLMFVGTGPYEEGLRALVRKRRLAADVIFAGFVPDAELPEYYAACDVFAIPSRFETQGLAVLEALASGRPVAGANFRAIPEFVREGESGHLFTPGNPEAAANAISRCLDHAGGLPLRARAQRDVVRLVEEHVLPDAAERVERLAAEEEAVAGVVREPALRHRPLVRVREAEQEAVEPRPVLRHEGRRAADDLRIAEDVEDPPEEGRRQDAIGVREEEDGAAGHLRPPVPPLARPLPL